VFYLKILNTELFQQNMKCSRKSYTFIILLTKGPRPGQLCEAVETPGFLPAIRNGRELTTFEDH
jgi:hypothetical protein